jgi:hypothetical protein
MNASRARRLSINTSSTKSRLVAVGTAALGVEIDRLADRGDHMLQDMIKAGGKVLNLST